jgi:acyl-CoA thioester hydrolase
VNEFGILLPRVEVHCQFLRPVRWDDVIEVHLGVSQLTDKSATYHLRIFRQGETDLLAEGTMTVVCIDREKFRATPFPAPFFELLQKRLIDPSDVDSPRARP